MHERQSVERVSAQTSGLIVSRSRLLQLPPSQSEGLDNAPSHAA
ncbi:MAG: hypothetical protein QOF71_3021 [Candidatus Eremiobacteraeota bacterium]|nr:hypothetical protein [Candidatus Eremiobacteraeota bacterium]